MRDAKTAELKRQIGQVRFFVPRHQKVQSICPRKLRDFDEGFSPV
jgi:hypothetical protein